MKFDTCVVLLNPNSTSYRHAAWQVKMIKKQFAKEQFFQHTLVPQDFVSSDQLLNQLERLGPESLLVIGAGDGTINTVVNLLRDKRLPAKSRQATILPLWGGNASDLAHMLNGHRHTNPKHILKKGRRTEVLPLEVKLGSQAPRVALAYVSIGAVAKTAQLLDASKWVSSKGIKRWFRFPMEAAVGLKGLNTSQMFSAELEGRKQQLYDVVCLNGNRMAKVYRAPARLHKSGFLALVIQRKHPTLLMHLYNLAAAWFKRPLHATISLKVLETTHMQLDGEVSTVPPKTSITIRQSSQPVYLLSTKL
jgi:diacylglycerol kinase family enzyme